MSNVVRLATSRPATGTMVRGPQYPRPTHAEVIEAEVNALYEISSAFFSASQDEQKLSAVLDRVGPLAGDYPKELKREIAKALEPATIDEIRKHIVLLLDSNPRAQRLTESFGDLVESDVGALQPSRGAIEAACRHLRTTPRPEFKPVPDIPEIVDTVKAKQMRLERACELIDAMPAKIAEAQKQLGECQRIRAEQRQRVKSEIRGDLLRGYEPREFHTKYYRSLVDEVRAEIKAEAEEKARQDAMRPPAEEPPKSDILPETISYF